MSYFRGDICPRLKQTMATAKLPHPRVLNKNETLDSLTQWKRHVRNYYRRDSNYKEFFSRVTTWDPLAENYGFEGDDKLERADNLEALLDAIAGYIPGPYVAEEITQQSRSIKDVFDFIWDHYDVNPTPSTFLDFNNISLEKEERYIDLYKRMLFHATQHVVPAGTKLETPGVTVAATEPVTHSHKNLIALWWMNKINPKLSEIVGVELAKEFKSGRQLSDLVPQISKNIDPWLRRYADKSRQKEEPEIRQVKYNRSSTGFQRGGGQRPPTQRSFPDQRNQRQKFCPGCHL